MKRSRTIVRDCFRSLWIPAFAGMTGTGFRKWLLTWLVVWLTWPAPVHAMDLPKAQALNKTGEKLVGEARFKEALETFTEMLASCGENQVCRGVATFFLGRVQMELGQFERSLDSLTQAEEIFAKNGNEEKKATVLVVEGQLHCQQGRYRDAIKVFTSASEILERSQNRAELFSAWNGVGVTYLYLCEYDRAMEAFEAAARNAPSPEDPRASAGLANNRALLLARKQEYAAADKACHVAYQFHEKAGDLKGMAIVLTNIGEIHEARSQYTEALARHEEALALARRAGAPSVEALALNNIGGIHLKRGDFKDALSAYEQALEIRNRLGIRHFAAETLNNRGLVNLALADYAHATADFQAALETCTEVGSLRCRALALHNLAYLCKDQGKFRESLDNSLKAVELAEQMGDRRLESTVVLRLGNISESQGLFDIALKYYERAAKIQNEIHDWNFLAKTHSSMADICTRAGDFAGAEVHHAEAIAINKRIGAPYLEQLCRLALFYGERARYATRGEKTSPEKDLAEARRHIEEAEAVHNPDNVNDFMLFTYVRGKIRLAQDPQAAVEDFETLKALAETSSVNKFIFLAAVGRGLAYEKLQLWSEAERSFRDATEYAEEIRRSLPPRERVAFLSGEEILGVKHILPFEGLARVLLQRGDAKGSLSAAEFTKARAFSEKLALRSEQVGLGIPEAIRKRDAELTNQMAGLLKGLQAAKESGNAAAVASHTRQIKVLEARMRGHIAKLRIEHPLFAATKYPQPVELADSKLRPDEWVLSYDVTDTGALLYLTRGKEIVKAIFKPVPREDLDGLIGRFRRPTEVTDADDLVTKLKSFDFASGKALTDLLVGDVLADLPQGTPVVVVPDDSLGVLPFEMLVLNREGVVKTDREIPYIVGADFLGDRNPVSYYQSITAMTLSRTAGAAGGARERILVVADPVFQQRDARAPKVVGPVVSAQVDGEIPVRLMAADDRTPLAATSLERLEVTGKLAESLAALYPGSADVYTGVHASKSLFLQEITSRLKDYGFIVVATHGFFSEDQPGLKEPVLVLTMVPPGTDGILTMSEILGLRTNAEIVALVACRSGLGRTLSGEGVMGMGRAFQFGGARSVLTSVWSVAAESSVMLVESFFRHLKDGVEKLEALRLARSEIRQDRFDHPFFWAPFILVGEVSPSGRK